MSILFQMFSAFFTIGLFAFGGGYAVLSFLQQEVERRGWMTTERFVDFIAISQSTPGPIAINMATFVGYEVAGVPGALAATLAVALPGIILIMIFALFVFHFYERPAVQAVFLGLRPAVVGLVAAAAWQIGKVAVVNWVAGGVSIVCILLIAKWKVSPVILVIGSAIAGILFF
ncbi:chromate transporter [Pontiella sulfatireligans]|uniref:Putative chromate transport protein n=1 Tax=Pontiella sulfatireligans TaxID=2750658 RepID=A0A6C2ULH6_9BACT|nr:chromate transporter [Pontiella sulfatireligans]VGO20046.1 putative chromate transport protein [Pontiella sulfatireligans]